MKGLLKQLEEFHGAFGHQVSHSPTASVNGELRHNLMVEETSEYLDAYREEDIVGIADALGDQLYILMGTIVSHGLQDIIGEVFEEIHRSNMSKLGEDGKPIYREDGKILKGPNYFKPDLVSILKKYGVKL